MACSSGAPVFRFTGLGFRVTNHYLGLRLGFEVDQGLGSREVAAGGFEVWTLVFGVSGLECWG